MNMNTCFLNVPEQGLHDDDIQYPERSMLLELRGSFVSVQLRTGSAKARATTPKHTHTQLHCTVASRTEWQHNIAQEQDKTFSFPFLCCLVLHALNLTSFHQCIKVAEAACGKGLKMLSRDMQGKATCCC